MSDQAYIRRQLEAQRGNLLPLEWTNFNARVYNSANITLTTGTGTVITFDSERGDTNAFHSTVSNTSRLVAQSAGFHSFGATVRFAANATGIREVGIRVNGSAFVAYQDALAMSGGAVTIISVASGLDLAIGDYIEFVAYQNSGGNLDIEAVGSYSPEAWIARNV